MADYYEVLGVSKKATQDEIKKAFRKKAHQLHPDKKTGDEKKFKEVNEAYQVLSDSQKRAQYDQFGPNFQGGGSRAGGGQGFGGFDFRNFSQGDFDFSGGFEDIFSDFFGGGRGRTQSFQGKDIQVDVEISFEEMVKGVKKDIRIRKAVQCRTCQGTGGAPGSHQETCKTCGGSGQIRKNIQTILGTMTQAAVCDTCHGRGTTFTQNCQTCHGAGRTTEEVTIGADIPAGISSGQMLSISGAGEAGEYGAPSGDLLVAVRVKPDKRFVREGHDIRTTKTISFATAALGGQVSVETIEGPLSMKIPSGTQPGETFRIKGKGIPYLGRSARGDQLVNVTVAIPTKLSRRAKTALETLQEETE
jgi:molecular chaperone DnaJ